MMRLIINKSIMKFLSYGVMIYMLLALIWWTILLTRNNNLLYQKKLELFYSKNLNSESRLDSNSIIKQKENELTEDYLKKKYMILGEGLVFGISLIIGLWFIQKSYNHELENTKKQNNFLLSITHELKSPIASITLITETLQKRKLPSEIIAQMHESILSESKRLESLVSNLLMAARLDNTYTYNFESCNLWEISDKVIKSIKIHQASAQISLKMTEEKCELECDRESIISVLNNLIENSLKYSSTPAIIDIEICNKQKNIELQVADLGFGILDVEKNKVMQQFYRTGNEETRQTKGTGLGLYIVSKIIEAHKGTIKITDNTPKGTIFTINLPKQQRV